MRDSTFDLENQLRREGRRYIIGVDEAGRGPLAGPVVAVAVVLKNLKFINGVNEIKDSKILSEKQRDKLVEVIENNFYTGVGICDHKTIDRINILQASFLAMKKAITDLNFRFPVSRQTNSQDWIVLVDGNKKIPNISIEQRAIVNGDQIVKSISAASIIAKVTRDRIMREMHERYPLYNFDRHKGYGTRLHLQCLDKYGPCEIHRKSFRPVALAEK